MSQPARQLDDDKKYPKNVIGLSIWFPLLCVAVVTVAFLLFRRLVPQDWAVHVDGYGNVTYGSWWWLFVGVLVIAGLSFVLGQYLARDFSNLGHWYPQQKSIVVICFATGYGVLGFLSVNMISAWNIFENSEPPGVEGLMGYGLLGFVLASTISASLYAKLLPKAKSLAQAKQY